jgi:hypothetical protein
MDGFRADIRRAMTEHGWAEPLWLETRPDDSGERLARQAVQSGVDLVLASGGDGTVTACVGGQRPVAFPARPAAGKEPLAAYDVAVAECLRLERESSRKSGGQGRWPR